VKISSRSASSSISQNPSLPLKELTPIIAKIRIKRLQTIVTLVIDGSEESKALTISFIPLFLEIIRRGRRALKALRAFTDWRLDETPDS
jgi:hypothetical protein